MKRFKKAKEAVVKPVPRPEDEAGYRWVEVQEVPGLKDFVKVVLYEREAGRYYPYELQTVVVVWGYRLRETTVGNTQLFDRMIRAGDFFDENDYRWDFSSRVQIVEQGRGHLFARIEKRNWLDFNSDSWITEYEIPLEVYDATLQNLNSGLRRVRVPIHGKTIDKHP